MASISEKIQLLEAPLIAVLTSSGVKEETLAKISDAGVNTLALFCNISGTAEELREFLKEGVGLDPKDLRGGFLEIAKLIGGLGGRTSDPSHGDEEACGKGC